MPEPTIANQIKHALFIWGRLDKQYLNKAVFKEYSEDDEVTDYDVVKFDSVNLGSNMNTWMLHTDNNVTLLDGISLWTEDYMSIDRILSDSSIYSIPCKINGKSYIITIDEQ
jgi:hypothetical protein